MITILKLKWTLERSHLVVSFVCEWERYVDTGSHFVAQAILEFTVELKLLAILLLQPPSAEIIDTQHHIRVVFFLLSFSLLLCERFFLGRYCPCV